MQIVLPGALPASAPIAAELAKRLPAAAPTLYAWMRAADARVEPFDPQEQGCTSFEAWQLRQAGFQPAPGQQLGAGLGPFLGGDAAAVNETVWIADLAHVALGTDQAVLLPAQSLELTAEEGAALFDAARPLFEDTGFAVQALQAHRWRVQLPAGMTLPTASPGALAGQPLKNWWRQDTGTRPWRRLLNEIQMVWHDHPVNEARAARGLPPINGLWLYGGGAQWVRPEPPGSTGLVVMGLHDAYASGDWAAWLDAVQHADASILKPLADADGQPSQPIGLLLMGQDRTAALTLKPRGRLLRWLPPPTKNWNAWWSPHA